MKLYFEHSNEEREFISTARNRDEAISLIYEDLHIRNPNFKIYYIRSWKNESNEEVFDIGSWAEFYILTSK